MANKRLAGITSVLINGAAFAVVDGISYSPNTTRKESLLGMDGWHGFKETPVAGFLSFTLRDTGIRVEDFNSMANASVVVNQANGKQIIGAQMVCVDVQEVDAVEGTLAVRFEGPDVAEVF